jgi:integrase
MATVYKDASKGAGNWYAAWRDHSGKRRTKCTFTTDKAAAKRIAAKYEADAALRRDGVVDAQLEGISDQSRRSIESHLADYEAMLKASNSDGKHVYSTLKYIRDICKAAHFETAGSLTADGVNHYATGLKKNGKSTRTVQAYLTAIKSFSRWLARNAKLPRDPLASVRKPSPQSDRRYERRMLLQTEWQWLRAAVKEDRLKMPATERVLLYATAIQTGLRSNELRSLTAGKCFLTGDKPYVVCKASSTKNAKEARQYVQRELAAELAAHVAKLPPKRSVFKMPDASDVSAMFKADLAAARTAWLDDAKDDPAEHAKRVASDFLAETNHEGEVIDFHSLRHTCGAWLAMSGVHPKVVQTIMRHSQITLTMDTYGHLFPGDEAAAVDKLGLLMGCVSKAVAETEGSATGSAQGDKLGEMERHSETLCETGQKDTASHKSFSEKTLCEAVRRGETLNESAPRRTRTYNPLIKSLSDNTENAGKIANSADSAASGAAVELASVFQAWVSLAPAIRAAVLALVNAA